MPTGVGPHQFLQETHLCSDAMPPRSREAALETGQDVSSQTRPILTSTNEVWKQQTTYAILALAWHTGCQALLQCQTQVVTPVRAVEQAPADWAQATGLRKNPDLTVDLTGMYHSCEVSRKTGIATAEPQCMRRCPQGWALTSFCRKPNSALIQCLTKRTHSTLP